MQQSRPIRPARRSHHGEAPVAAKAGAATEIRNGLEAGLRCGTSFPHGIKAASPRLTRKLSGEMVGQLSVRIHRAGMPMAREVDIDAVTAESLAGNECGGPSAGPPWRALQLRYGQHRVSCRGYQRIPLDDEVGDRPAVSLRTSRATRMTRCACSTVTVCKGSDVDSEAPAR
jgi:hypothetical protein